MWPRSNAPRRVEERQAALQALPHAPRGTILDISDIIANMDAKGLSPDIMEFARAAARDLALASR